MKVVVDSSILIDYLRGGTKWEAFMSGAHREIELFIPTVVIFELFSGTSTRNPRKRENMVDFIKQFHRIDLDEKIAQEAGELFRDLKKTLQVPDYIIAASALNIGATVVTLNQRHFGQIPHLPLYPLERQN